MSKTIVNVKPVFNRRFCNQIEIVGLSRKMKQGGFSRLGDDKFVANSHRVFVVRSHIIRDRIRKDPAGGPAKMVHVDRECVFEIREDVLRARYNLDGVSLPR